MSPALHIGILDLAHKRPFYAALLDGWAVQVADVSSHALDAVQSLGLDLLLVNDDHGSAGASAMLALRAAGVPSLQLVDGIVEWRNCFEHPRNGVAGGGVPLLRPSVADVIACLGPAQLRVLEALGNGGRCVVTGSPRFDVLGPQRPCMHGGGPRVLVLSARTPGFDAGQLEQASAAFADVHALLAQTAAQVRWRVSEPVASRLPAGLEPAAGELEEELHQADWVIAQPSTSALQAMVLGKPVLLLDYSGVPAWLHSGWMAGDRGTLQARIGALLAGPTAMPDPRCWWQDVVVADQVVADGQASLRVRELAQWLAEAGRRARLAGTALARLPTDLHGCPPRWAATDSSPGRDDTLAQLEPAQGRLLASSPLQLVQSVIQLQRELVASQQTVAAMRASRRFRMGRWLRRLWRPGG